MKAGWGKRLHSFHLRSTLRYPPMSIKVLGQNSKLFKLTTFDPFHYWTNNTHTHTHTHRYIDILMLLLSCFSRVRLCVTPKTAAHQAPPSLGFSRKEHWSGLPFPSPMHKREKWKWSRSVVSDSSQPHGLQPTRPLHPWDSPGKSTGVGCHCLLQDRLLDYYLQDILIDTLEVKSMGLRDKSRY